MEATLWLIGSLLGMVSPVLVAIVLPFRLGKDFQIQKLDAEFRELCQRCNLPMTCEYQRTGASIAVRKLLGSADGNSLDENQVWELRRSATRLDRAIKSDRFRNFFSFAIGQGYSYYLIISRALLIGIAFTTFRASPWGIYIETWTRFLPGVR